MSEHDVVVKIVDRLVQKGLDAEARYPGEYESDCVLSKEGAEKFVEALEAFEEMNIVVFDHTTRVGSIYLVYGNEEDGSELICDHSLGDVIKDIVDYAEEGCRDENVRDSC